MWLVGIVNSLEFLYSVDMLILEFASNVDDAFASSKVSSVEYKARL